MFHLQTAGISGYPSFFSWESTLGKIIPKSFYKDLVSKKGLDRETLTSKDQGM